MVKTNVVAKSTTDECFPEVQTDLCVALFNSTVCTKLIFKNDIVRLLANWWSVSIRMMFHKCVRVSLYVCMCVCMCMYVCEYVCMYVCMCVYVCVCVCIYMYVCMYVCMCVCINQLLIHCPRQTVQRVGCSRQSVLEP